jgi:hypothetical protein
MLGSIFLNLMREGGGGMWPTLVLGAGAFLASLRYASNQPRNDWRRSSISPSRSTDAS